MNKPVLVTGNGEWHDVCSYVGPERGSTYPNNFIWESRDDCHSREQVTHWTEIPPVNQEAKVTAG